MTGSGLPCGDGSGRWSRDSGSNSVCGVPAHRRTGESTRARHEMLASMGWKFQAACHERQDLRRGAIEPLLSSTRHINGCSSATSEIKLRTARPIRKRFGAGPALTPIAVRNALGNRHVFEAIHHRRQQLVNAGEGELHLRLDTRGAHHTAARPSLGDVIQQAVFPTPGSPSTTSARLSPERTASMSRPSTLRSLCRPVSPGVVL